MIFHDAQLKLIHAIHEHRSPFLDSFFKALDFFDRQEFFFILIPMIWLFKGWKTGLRLYYILSLSALFNQVFKGIFLSPRPYHLDPSVSVIQVSGLGFPSGAAQTVILLSGLMLIYAKGSWKWPLAFIYIGLVSFSRVYLGVHFFTDVLAGWAVGGLLLMIYLTVFPLIEKGFEKTLLLLPLLLSQIIPLLLLFYFYSPSAIRTYSLAMGMGLGAYLIDMTNLTLPHPNNIKDILLRLCIGILGVGIVHALIVVLPFNPFIGFFLLGFFASYGIYFLAARTQRVRA